MVTCWYRPQLGKSRERGLNWTFESRHWSAGIKTVLRAVRQYVRKSCGPGRPLINYSALSSNAGCFVRLLCWSDVWEACAAAEGRLLPWQWSWRTEALSRRRRSVFHLSPEVDHLNTSSTAVDFKTWHGDRTFTVASPRVHV